MHRFYLPALSRDAVMAALTDGEAAHAAKVLRVMSGETLMLLNGRGLRALARVLKVDRKRVELQVEHREETPRPPFDLVLFQAATKPRSMEWIVQKATELGVYAIQPMLTVRVVSQWAEGEAETKVEKWQRIAVESLKQCGQPWLPHIAAPARLADLLGAAPHSFLASLEAGARPLRAWLQEQPEIFQPGNRRPVGLWIGPEGDFAPDETRMLLAAGALPMTLGPAVLRSETAALCGMALLHYELNLIRAAIAPGRETTGQSGPDESAS
ncbi:MAG: 16S rRNA (uracil(1498)-N(3))-methyltransferase [Verrucomicrobia bacterium]|jgi:16S rRNA (uracil1498-N3)-methyltransferase|nr:16S rRNA (uracil(1498)-N(3))-methyltransferase [Verrucomicrobiota bacterium]